MKKKTLGCLELDIHKIWPSLTPQASHAPSQILCSKNFPLLHSKGNIYLLHLNP